MTDTEAASERHWLSAPLRFMRRNPFSTIALCNIVGDLGYLGFSVDADHSVSAAKLLGALCTLPAHVVLLAHGDKEAAKISAEDSWASHALMHMRAAAKMLVKPIDRLLVKPQAIAFGILTGNGMGLAVDGISKFAHHVSMPISATTFATGASIVIGCGLFAAADLVKNVDIAKRLQRAAPVVLLGTTFLNIGMAGAALAHDVGVGSVSMAVGATAFIVSNIAGFFAPVNKQSHPSSDTDMSATTGTHLVGELRPMPVNYGNLHTSSDSEPVLKSATSTSKQARSLPLDGPPI